MGVEAVIIDGLLTRSPSSSPPATSTDFEGSVSWSLPPGLDPVFGLIIRFILADAGTDRLPIKL